MLLDYITPDTPGNITNVFLATTAATAALGITFRTKQNNRLIESLPTIAVSLGILGTFVGIFIGLYTFDVGNIDKSVPLLLEGLKTAFLTSIAGMIASLAMKISYDIIGGKEDKAIKYNDPVPVLIDIHSSTEEIKNNSEAATNALLKCFKSDEEYSLISQVKLIRQEMIDSRREIKDSLALFTQKLTEASTETLVQALKQVIDDFNILLGELVGDRFKDLSTAMIQLNEWQDNYKQQVEASENRLREIINASMQTSTALERATSQIANLHQSMDSISASLNNITTNTTTLDNSSNSISENTRTLEEALKQIQALGNESKNVLPNMVQSVNTLTETLKQTVDSVATRLDKSSSDFIDINTQSLNRFAERIVSINESLQQSTKNLEEHLEKQLNSSLDSLASALGTLSNKFVSDYTPLTEKLKQIIEISSKTHASE